MHISIIFSIAVISFFAISGLAAADEDAMSRLNKKLEVISQQNTNRNTPQRKSRNIEDAVKMEFDRIEAEYLASFKLKSEPLNLSGDNSWGLYVSRLESYCLVHEFKNKIDNIADIIYRIIIEDDLESAKKIKADTELP